MLTRTVTKIEAGNQMRSKNLMTAAVGALLLTAPAVAHATPVLDVVFAMDSSGSIGTAGWTQEKAFVADIIASYLDGDRASVLSFATGTPFTKFHLTDVDSSSAEGLVSQVNGMSYLNGSTYTKNAMQAVANEFDANSPEGNARLAFLITDGNPNPPSSQNPCSTDTSAQALQSQLSSLNVRTIIIGVGADINPSTLACLLRDSSDYIPVGSFSAEDFATIQQQLADVIDEQAPTTSVPAQGGAALFLGAAAVALRRRRRG
jgi:hypothetical protein